MDPVKLEQLKSTARMLLKASLGAGLGAALQAAASALSSVDFGPTGNVFAMLVGQTIVQLIDVLKLRPPAPPAAS